MNNIIDYLALSMAAVFVFFFARGIYIEFKNISYGVDEYDDYDEHNSNYKY
jgi:hypothetical protein